MKAWRKNQAFFVDIPACLWHKGLAKGNGSQGKASKESKMTRFHLTHSECEVLFDLFNGGYSCEEDWNWFANEIDALANLDLFDALDGTLTPLGELAAAAVGEADCGCYPEGLCFFFHED